MIDYARLCDVVCARLGSAGAEATAGTGAALLHALGAAAAELRRQRDAAQAKSAESRHECPADLGATANCQTCDMAADATTFCDVLRRELYRVQRERDEARNGWEHETNLRIAAVKNCDALKSRLAELEPLVAAVVERHKGWEFDDYSIRHSPTAALVLHERRRAKERADGD